MRRLGVVGRAAWEAIRRFVDGHHLTHASSIAYFALLSLFPFVLLIFSVLGGATSRVEDRQALLDFILRYFPQQFGILNTQLDAMRDNHVSLGLAGSLLTLWASLGVFGAITSAVNYAWGVEKQPNYFQHKLVSFLMLLAAGGLLLIALGVVSVREMATASWLQGSDAARWADVLSSYSVRWATLLVVIFVAGLLFYFVPNTKVRFRDVWLGALLTGLLWRLSFSAFAYYLSERPRFAVHGPLGAVIAFLVWVYVSAAVLLYGVEFTAAYARLAKAARQDVGHVRT